MTTQVSQGKLNENRNLMWTGRSLLDFDFKTGIDTLPLNV